MGEYLFWQAPWVCGVPSRVGQGSRQILLREEDLRRGSVETWVRLENGGVVGNIELNVMREEDGRMTSGADLSRTCGRICPDEDVMQI